MLLQKNKAALIPVVPARYSVVCHSQAEQREREVAVLFSYHLEHTMSQTTNDYKHLALSQVHAK